MRVADLSGKRVIQAGQEVGEVEDAIVNVENRSASGTDLSQRVQSADHDLPGRPSVTVVRGELRSHADLSESARQATVEQESERLVIRGTVESAEMKQQVGKIVTAAAKESQVDNQLTVRSVAE